MRFLFRRIGSAYFLTLAVCAVVVLSGEQAKALCSTPQEQGNWVNADRNTRSITRINVRFVCQDVILNGRPHPPGPPYYVHLFGSCTPTDCDWGERGARRLDSGHIYSFYDQGFAKRYVYARMSAFRPGQLWVHIYTDFTDPNRADYRSNNWFRPE